MQCIFGFTVCWNVFTYNFISIPFFPDDTVYHADALTEWALPVEFCGKLKFQKS